MAVRAQSLRGSILTGAPSVDPPVRAQQLRGSILAGAPTVAPAVRTQQLRGSILAGAAFIPPVRTANRVECDFIWLLDVVVSGRVYRFADRQVAIDTKAGDTLIYREGLAPLIWSTAADGAVDLSIPVAITSGVLWGLLVTDHYTVDRAPATLRRWAVGDLFEEARIIVEGRLEGTSYAAAGEEISFDVRRPGHNNGGTIPSGGMVVDSTTWPSFGRPAFEPDEKILGAYYPIVIGKPGIVPGGAVAATEALAVEVEITPVPNDTERLMIAGHKVVATTVEVFDYTDAAKPEISTCPVHTVDDLAGRTISYVSPNDDGVPVFTERITAGRIYYVGWLDGGMRNPFAPGALRGAGDVIEWVITRWSDLKFDGARFGAVRDLLNLYRVDTYINDAMDPVEWLMTALIPFLPAEPRNGENGLYFVVRRSGLTKADAVAHFDTSRNCDRTSNIDIIADDIVNEITVEYCPDRATGRFRERVIIGANSKERFGDEIQNDLGTDSRIISNYRAKISRELFKKRFSATLRAEAVCDRATAVRIGEDVLERHALPKRVLDLNTKCEFEETIRVGDIVLVTDEPTALVEQLAEVRDVVVGGSTVPIFVELIDDPVIG